MKARVNPDSLSARTTAKRRRSGPTVSRGGGGGADGAADAAGGARIGKDSPMMTSPATARQAKRRRPAIFRSRVSPKATNPGTDARSTLRNRSSVASAHNRRPSRGRLPATRSAVRHLPSSAAKRRNLRARPSLLPSPPLPLPRPISPGARVGGSALRPNARALKRPNEKSRDPLSRLFLLSGGSAQSCWARPKPRRSASRRHI